MTDLSAKFRDKFFAASQLSKDEKTALKTLFPRDKRGQGLAYRLIQSSKVENGELEMPLGNLRLGTM